MRDRKDIESEVSSSWVDESGELQFNNADEVEIQELVLEVLLDIRDIMLGDKAIILK